MERKESSRAATAGLCLTAALLLAGATGVRGEEYRFDLSEFEEKPYHLGGYGELRPVLNGLDRESALYRLRFFDRDEGDTTAEYNGRLQLEASLEKGRGRIFVRVNSDFRDSYLGESLETTSMTATSPSSRRLSRPAQGTG